MNNSKGLYRKRKGLPLSFLCCSSPAYFPEEKGPSADHSIVSHVSLTQQHTSACAAELLPRSDLKAQVHQPPRPLALNMSTSPFGAAHLQHASLLASRSSSPGSSSKFSPPNSCSPKMVASHISPPASPAGAFNKHRMLCSLQKAAFSKASPSRTIPALGTCFSTTWHAEAHPPDCKLEAARGEWPVCLETASCGNFKMNLSLPTAVCRSHTPSTLAARKEGCSRAPFPMTEAQHSTRQSPEGRPASVANSRKNSSKNMHRMPSIKSLQDKADTLYRHSLCNSASPGNNNSKAGAPGMLRWSSLEGFNRANSSFLINQMEFYRLSSPGICRFLTVGSAVGTSLHHSGASLHQQNRATPTSAPLQVDNLGAGGGDKIGSREAILTLYDDLPLLNKDSFRLPKASSLGLEDTATGEISMFSCRGCSPSRSHSSGMRRPMCTVRSARGLNGDEGSGGEVVISGSSQGIKNTDCQPFIQHSELVLAQVTAQVELAASLAGVPDHLPLKSWKSIDT